jgi:hypothetical protein
MRVADAGAAAGGCAAVTDVARDVGSKRFGVIGAGAGAGARPALAKTGNAPFTATVHSHATSPMQSPPIILRRRRTISTLSP